MTRSNHVLTRNLCNPLIRHRLNRSTINRDGHKTIKKGIIEFILNSRFQGKNMTHSSQSIILPKQIMGWSSFIAKSRRAHQFSESKIRTSPGCIIIRYAVDIIGRGMKQR